MRLQIMLVATLSISILISCTEKRKEQFVQGQGIDLLMISEYDGKLFDLTTENQIGQTNVSKAGQVKIASKTQSVHSFGLVNYKTEANLLKSTPLIAKENHKYQIKYVLTDNYLKVFKIGSQTDIPVQEQTFADSIENKKLAVPLLGYPIKGYFVVDNLKNDLSEKTSQLYEKSVKTKSEATHFKVDFNAPVLFEPVLKIDILPAKLFEGEWFFTETMIAKPEIAEGIIGNTGALDSKFESSDKIKFIKNSYELRGVNLNIDSRIQKDELNYTTAIALPVHWKSFRVAPNGNDKSLREEENNEKRWEDREFVQVDFESLKSVTTNSAQKKLVDLEITDNYFSFTLQNLEENIRTKYSFLKSENRNYKAKNHFKKDFQKFGYFTTEKNVLKTFDIYRKEDIEKNVYINRFNPNNKEIAFHFTQNSPEWTRVAARTAVNNWNKAFKEAGSEINVVLNENFDVSLGDLRYNALNIIESVAGADGLLGYGPSLSDPNSGEIISATTNLYVTPIKLGLIDSIRKYLLTKLGILNENYIMNDAVIDNRFLNINKAGNLEVSGGRLYNLTGFNILLPGNNNKELVKSKLINKVPQKLGRQADFAVSLKNLFSEIESQCPEVVTYLHELQSKNVLATSKENSVLESCAKTLTPVRIISTMVHEIGHNLGLRHNFIGSTDTKNFLTKEQTKTPYQVRSSSVMEYMDPNEDILTIAGPYDIAAIRYGYADAIETEDKRIIKLDTTKTIEANLAALNTQSKQFKFCTDEDVYWGTDPMCDTFDSGATPMEVVDSIIHKYNAATANMNYSYDRARKLIPYKVAEYKVENYFIPLKRFYDQWRVILAQAVGQGNEYLEKFSSTDYQNFLNKMQNDPRFKEQYAQYKPVADKIFNFFMKIAFLQNRYCVFQTSEGQNIVELENIRNTLYAEQKTTVNSCKDANSVKYISDKFGGTLISEEGYPLHNYRYDMSDKAALESFIRTELGNFETFDVIGQIYDRANAAGLIGVRNESTLSQKISKFQPNFLDEPMYRDRFIQSIMDRSLKGVSSKTLRTLKSNNETYFNRFNSEKALISSYLEIAIDGLLVPGKTTENTSRMARFEVFTTYDENFAEKAKAAIALNGVNILAMSENNDVSIQILHKLSSLMASKKMTKLTLNDFESFLKLSIYTDEQVKNMKIEDFINYMGEISALFEKHKEAAVIYGEAINDVLQIFIQLSEGIGNLPADKKKEILSSKLIDILKKSNPNLTEIPSFDMSRKTIEEEIVEQLKLGNSYKKESDDFEAQMDTLVNFVMMR